MTCTRCQRERRVPGQRWGRRCRAAYTRAHRRPYRFLSVTAKQPCGCGVKTVQAHHRDYTRPDLVDWLCRKCHTRAHHVA